LGFARAYAEDECLPDGVPVSQTGGTGKTKTRYVVLEHRRGEDVHCDLMLQRGDKLVTWQLDRLEELVSGMAVQAERIQDHRLAYLEYEGEISGGRGRVKRLACGCIERTEWDPREIRAVLSGDLEGKLFARHLVANAWRLVLSRSLRHG